MRVATAVLIRRAAGLSLLAGTLFTIPAAQTKQRAADTVHNYSSAHKQQILQEFAQLLAIPNTAQDPAGLERNAEFIANMMRARGVETVYLRGHNSPPVILGELRVPGARRTIGFYAHYDGQPVSQKDWRSGPFDPVLRNAANTAMIDISRTARFDPESRIWARSASDDKAAIIGLMTTLESLRESHFPIRANLKFLFDGEEESGSPHLAEILSQHRRQIVADAWLICDGPVNAEGQQQLFFGVRGLAQLDMTVYGPAHPVHSGTYGNWVPNPIADLVQLLSRMRSPGGTISIPGFYRNVRPPSAAERAALAQLPPDGTLLRSELALGRTEGHGETLAERVMLPALNLRGIRAGQTGSEATNAIQERASASIDFRLVPNQTPEEVRVLTENYLSRLGYFIVHSEPDRTTRFTHPRVIKLLWGPGYPAVRTSMVTPIAISIIETVENVRGTQAVLVPTSGGSSPLYALKQAANTPIIVVPIANHDNNQHAANENIRLGNLWDGTELYGALMTIDLDSVQDRGK